MHIKKEINLIEPYEENNETFFGYYDKSPENNNGLIIYNETSILTSKKPSANRPIWINIQNTKNHSIVPVSESFSYNWQQGCRAQWISDNMLIYNYFNDKTKSYEAAIYSVIHKQVIKTFDLPVQDSYKDYYYLSIIYSRIMKLRSDYGYRNLPLPDDDEMQNIDSDGIWKVDFNSGLHTLIFSLKNIVILQPALNSDISLHKINHVMISPNGEKFIFIHRWYHKGKRFDRLMLFHNSELKILANDEMVSHMCWIDNFMLFGYLRFNGTAGFYFININTGNIISCDELNALNNGDGHPSCYKDWIVIDSYPDKSRMQHLTLYNYKTKTIIPLLEVLQPLKYQGETRCDMHPRFSPDGKRIYFDTTYTGKRRLAFIDVSSIIS